MTENSAHKAANAAAATGRTAGGARKKAANATDSAQKKAAHATDTARNTAASTSDSARKAATNATESAHKAAGSARAQVSSGVTAGVRSATTTVRSATNGVLLAWTAMKNRKQVAIAAGTGFVGLMAASFAAGRRTARPKSALSRLTGGRL